MSNKTDWENEGGWTENATRDAEDVQVCMITALVQPFLLYFCLISIVFCFVQDNFRTECVHIQVRDDCSKSKVCQYDLWK